MIVCQVLRVKFYGSPDACDLGPLALIPHYLGPRTLGGCSSGIRGREPTAVLSH